MRFCVPFLILVVAVVSQEVSFTLSAHWTTIRNARIEFDTFNPPGAGGPFYEYDDENSPFYWWRSSGSSDSRLTVTPMNKLVGGITKPFRLRWTCPQCRPGLSFDYRYKCKASGGSTMDFTLTLKITNSAPVAKKVVRELNWRATSTEFYATDLGTDPDGDPMEVGTFSNVTPPGCGDYFLSRLNGKQYIEYRVVPGHNECQFDFSINDSFGTGVGTATVKMVKPFPIPTVNAIEIVLGSEPLVIPLKFIDPLDEDWSLEVSFVRVSPFECGTVKYDQNTIVFTHGTYTGMCKISYMMTNSMSEMEQIISVTVKPKPAYSPNIPPHKPIQNEKRSEFIDRMRGIPKSYVFAIFLLSSCFLTSLFIAYFKFHNNTPPTIVIPRGNPVPIQI